MHTCATIYGLIWILYSILRGQKYTHSANNNNNNHNNNNNNSLALRSHQSNMAIAHSVTSLMCFLLTRSPCMSAPIHLQRTVGDVMNEMGYSVIRSMWNFNFSNFINLAQQNNGKIYENLFFGWCRRILVSNDQILAHSSMFKSPARATTSAHSPHNHRNDFAQSWSDCTERNACTMTAMASARFLRYQPWLVFNRLLLYERRPCPWCLYIIVIYTPCSLPAVIIYHRAYIFLYASGYTQMVFALCTLFRESHYK